MNGFILLIPFFLIRFGLLWYRDRESVRRAAHFAPMTGNEMAAYWLYQISNTAIIIYLCFLKVQIRFSGLFLAGTACYLLGLLLCAVSVIGFSSPSAEGLNTEGIYGFSRHPMYVSYFICFTGCALLTESWILGGIILVFQISSHWIVLAEERECEKRFGEDYRRYRKKVRRYIKGGSHGRIASGGSRSEGDMFKTEEKKPAKEKET